MPKAAISVTIDRDNLMWLSARARSTRARSLSQTLDELITAARLQHQSHDGPRSIVGMVEIPEDDPDLTKADAYIRELFEVSLNNTARQLAGKAEPRRRRTRRTRRA